MDNLSYACLFATSARIAMAVYIEAGDITMFLFGFFQFLLLAKCHKIVERHYL